MDLYGQKSSSLPQKLVILSAELALLTLSYFVLFEDLLASIRTFGTQAEPKRNAILFAFNVIVFARFLLTLFVFLKRKIPLEETFSVPLAFALYLIGFPLLARGSEVPLAGWELVGAALFLLGSFLNTYSEYQRHVFKQKPSSKGRLYTGGLFGLSMHINYFGDLLWVSGYAIVTRNLYSAAIPAFLFCFFQFFNIPKLDAYLKERYGAAFETYKGHTKGFIPFVL